MRILGISCYYHDAAAALVRDGRLVAAAEEERFSRVKHDSGFPANAIAYCLREEGIGIDAVDHVVFYEKPLVKFDRILETILTGWPRTFPMWMRSMPLWLTDRLRIGRRIQDDLGIDGDVLFASHHLAHAAAAYYGSGFDEAAVLTADGVGEWTSTSWGVGRGTDLEMRGEIRFPHSVGLLYSALTAYLGFRVNDAEWKVMGLAAYGEPRYLDRFRRLVETRDDGSFRLRMEYFAFHRSTRRMFNGRWRDLFGQGPRGADEPIEAFHRDLAASGQKLVEELMLGLARHVRADSGLDRLCLAGGVGLNSVANWRILRECGYRDLFVFPAAGDSGGAVGAAWHVHHRVLGRDRAPALTDVYLGPGYDDDEIAAALRGRDAAFDRFDDDGEVIDRTARALADGRIVGWFQGRMELGPRALGARSILADPRRAEAKEIVNARVKYREAFRPFAPSVPREDAHRWFEMPEGMAAPYMLLVPPVRPECRDRIPAVTHADGTARVQTVDREVNPMYWRLLRRFGELTGVPVLLNTSFNVRGEPIVMSPADAWRTFTTTGLDLLVAGRCLVSAKPGEVDHAAAAARSRELDSGRRA